jgi:hypothetical protein
MFLPLSGLAFFVSVPLYIVDVLRVASVFCIVFTVAVGVRGSYYIHMLLLVFSTLKS